MPQTINTNVASLNAQRNLNTSQSSLATSMERLSSGLRVNSAKDDAAGLAIADRMNAQIRGMNVAIRNANDGISLAQTAEGALATMTDALQRMRELAVQALNGSNGTGDRNNLDTEFQALAQEVGRIATQTKFNGTAIVGPSAGAQVFQVGANVGDTLTVTTTQVTTIAGGVSTADLRREPVGGTRAHHGRRLRGRNLEHVARADPAAGRHRDGGPGQPAAAAGAAAVAQLSPRAAPVGAPWPAPVVHPGGCRRSMVLKFGRQRPKAR
jgi:flagellin-like hook-associated protein FlgL